MPAPNLIAPPYGGRLVSLVAPAEALEQLRAYGASRRSLRLSPRAICDLELLANGAFSPLDRFMGRDTYHRVLAEMRLGDGTFWPMPITLPLDPGSDIQLDTDVALRDQKNEILALLTVEEIYEWDRRDFARQVFGTTDAAHPMVAELGQWGARCVSGRLRVLSLPVHHDFRSLRLTPADVRGRLADRGQRPVIAFEPPPEMHRGHETFIKRTLTDLDGTLLLHPVAGPVGPGDADHYARIGACVAVVERHYDRDRVLIALSALATRSPGPREVPWHAIVHRNFGATHFIVAPGQLDARVASDIGIEAIEYAEPPISDDRRYVDLVGGNALGRRDGVCVWLTGLSGAGKSTIAEILTMLLMERGRRVTILDGDVVRTHLSKGLGFTREDRDTNIGRIGFVAAEIVRHGGAVVCAAVSPYRAARAEVRHMIGADRFVEVFVDTPLEVCMARDPKGMYARARRGELKGLTGVDDPYERPEAPDVHLDGASGDGLHHARIVLEHLDAKGLLSAAAGSPS